MQRALIALLIVCFGVTAACSHKPPKEKPPLPPAEATTGVEASGAGGANANSAAAANQCALDRCDGTIEVAGTRYGVAEGLAFPPRRAIRTGASCWRSNDGASARHRGSRGV